MTHSTPFSSITISPDRQRQEFDPEALTDLANSISARGLLHAIVLRDTPEGPTLVAGERRLRAMESLWAIGCGVIHNGTHYPPETVPYVTLGELSELEAEEAELDENLKRKDLSWQEQASALARLHALRSKQAAAIGETQSLRETQAEAVASSDAVPKSYQPFRETLLLAEHLDNPEVAKAKTAKDAFKILQRQEATAKNEELAARVGKTFNSSVHSLVHADCLEWLRNCPANTFDVICTDPPYGMDAQSFGDGGGKLSGTEHHYDDTPEAWNKLIRDLVPALFRVAKPQAHAYVFCDIEKFPVLKLQMESAGWYVFRTPLTVYKLGSGRVPLPEHGPRRTSEWCLYAIKGNRPVTAIYNDVIPCKLEENIGHGANKPVELYTDLLRRSVRPGDSVLDCFAGTGTIFPAAHMLKVSATGIELSAEYYAIAVKRLNALDEEPEMI